MENSIHTPRLTLSELHLQDTEFIFELLNTPEWIKFIGDKNIKTLADAAAYIEKIRQNPISNYWVVKLKDTGTSIGVVTFMKRDYLENYDIGYAFLQHYGKTGYAFEATKQLLDEVIPHHKKIVATVLEDNENSIRLLEKLGLQYEKKIVVNNETLLLYSIIRHG